MTIDVCLLTSMPKAIYNLQNLVIAVIFPIDFSLLQRSKGREIDVEGVAYRSSFGRFSGEGAWIWPVLDRNQGVPYLEAIYYYVQQRHNISSRCVKI